jgi:predicted transcriptional regulator
MKISKDALIILTILAKRDTLGVRELVKESGLKNSNISRAIKELNKFGIISTKQVGHQKQHSLSSYELSDLFRTVISSLPIKDIHNILSGNRLEIVALLSREKGVEELSDMLKVTQRTVKNNLKYLLLRGIINQKKNGGIKYYVRPKVHVLSRLAAHIIQRFKETEVKGLFKTAILVRVIEQDVLVKTTEFEEVSGYYPTCYNVFHKFGVFLILKDEFYWVNKDPKIEDVIIHTLKLDKDSTRGTIYVAALMYKNWEKIDFRKLRSVGFRYRIDKRIDGLLGFVKNRGWKNKSKTTYPQWSEVKHVLGVE